MTQVSKNVGFDGESFYCIKCGRAGFRSELAARGHLGSCRGRLVSQGIDPALLAAPAHAAGASAVGAPMLAAAAVAAPSSSQLGDSGAQGRGFSPEPVGYQDYVGQ